MADPAVAAVKGAGIGNIKMAHELGKIGPRSFNDQMKMVPHQYVGVQNRLVNPQRASEPFQEDLAMPVVSVDRPAVVAAAGDVIIGVSILNPQWAGHGLALAGRPP